MGAEEGRCRPGEAGGGVRLLNSVVSGPSTWRHPAERGELKSRAEAWGQGKRRRLGVTTSLRHEEKLSREMEIRRRPKIEP